jgi:hypothetical protein
MNPILSSGILIGLLCGVWTFVMGVTGWYKDPVMTNIFFVVILFEVGGLVWGLRRTAALGRNYGQQVMAGTMMAVVAGVIIVACSLVFTMVVYPDYASAIENATRATLQGQGRSEVEIAEALRANAASTTPMAQAMSGFIGTLITGIVASAVIAISIRARPR